MGVYSVWNGQKRGCVAQAIVSKGFCSIRNGRGGWITYGIVGEVFCSKVMLRQVVIHKKWG